MFVSTFRKKRIFFCLAKKILFYGYPKRGSTFTKSVGVYKHMFLNILYIMLCNFLIFISALKLFTDFCHSNFYNFQWYETKPDPLSKCALPIIQIGTNSWVEVLVSKNYPENLWRFLRCSGEKHNAFCSVDQISVQ